MAKWIALPYGRCTPAVAALQVHCFKKAWAARLSAVANEALRANSQKLAATLRFEQAMAVKIIRHEAPNRDLRPHQELGIGVLKRHLWCHVAGCAIGHVESVKECIINISLISEVFSHTR